MAGHNYSDPEKIYMFEPDGGEAEPRPLKVRKLVDVMERDEQRLTPKASTPRVEGSKPVLTPRAFKPSRPTPPVIPEQEISRTYHAVLSVTPSEGGETVAVVMALPNPVAGRSQRVSFRLLVEQYAELGVKTGEISPETADVILDAGRLCGAIRRGMTMLGYGDQSARRLAHKLTAKGVDHEMAARAVEYLTERGYIREENTATLRARQGVNKGWGERRIREDLFALEFTREAVEEALDDLSDVDWEENCVAAIRKKYRVIPEERSELQKLVAAMVRLGYDTDTVKSSLRRMMRRG